VPPSACLTTLPDYEHPRLVLVLPPVQRLSHADWYDNYVLPTQLASCLIYSYALIEYINRFAVDRMDVLFHDVTLREIRGRKGARFLYFP